MPHAPDELLLQLLAIFVSAKVVGELFERVRLPSVLGEILAGAVLGPFALGWVHPSETLHSIAEIGAIFVLFSAGLETSPQELIRVGRKALLVAVAGVVVPFVLGFALHELAGRRQPAKRFLWERPWWPPAWESRRGCWATCG